MAINQNRTLIEKYGIPLSHIDFDYVNNCNDPKILKGIIKILESGEEGLFPQLLRATETRLREIKPDASILNRKLCFAQKSSDLIPNEENEDILDDIGKWIRKTNEQENDPQRGKQNSGGFMNGHDERPVRKSIDLTSMFNSEKPEQELSMPKVSQVHNSPLQVSYSKWDKYDPEVELMKLDNKEKIEKLQTIKKKNINSNSLSVGMNGTSNFNDRVESMKSYSMSGTLRPQEVAKREKELGNEFFKSKDYEEALRHYNTSISIHSTLEAKNNRAMSYLKLKRFELALDDLREVIEKDPRNVKAHFRRGSCFKEISMYCLALRSFEATLKYDCNNLQALSNVKELKNLISNLPPKKLIRVREITRHYDQSVWDIEDPFRVSYGELSELNKESVEYLYEADPYGCLTECVCHLCPWHEWQERKKKWIRHKILKSEGTRKRWQFLVPDIVPESITKSRIPEFQKPKRLNIIDINSAKTNGHHNNSTNINHNGVNGTDKSPCEYCESDGLSLKTVSSVHEFLQSWKTVSQKNNYELFHKLLRSIKPKDLPNVISTNLDEEIMSKFLKTLCQKFDPDSELDLIIEYLRAMTKVKRFNLIAKMLDNKVKEDVHPLLKRIHHYTQDNIFLAFL